MAETQVMPGQNNTPQTVITPVKPFWHSKTIWTGLGIMLIPLIEYFMKNFSQISPATAIILGMIVIVLRLATGQPVIGSSQEMPDSVQPTQ